MMAGKITEEQVIPWVEASLENQDVKDYTIILNGRSDRGEGYASEVVFVTVAGIRKSTETKIDLNLVLKVGKDFGNAGPKDLEFRKIYEREMFVYDTIFPVYKKFEESKGIKQVFNSIPKRVNTLTADGKVIIVLENLRTEGYVPHDRLTPMNINHMKIVLKNYAKFHAIGFSLRDQQEDEFKKLTPDNYQPLKMMRDNFESMFKQKIKTVQDAIEKKEASLAERLNTLMNNFTEKLQDEAIEESTITHGDCWNSNFLFKYYGDHKESPTHVAILDWQMSSFTSPTLDLAYFMFAVSSTEQVAEFENLLQFYYDHLCNNIKEFGSDPEQLYPYSTFRKHWKKFSFISLVFVFSMLDFILIDTNEVKKFDEFGDLEERTKFLGKIKAKNYDLYLERIIAVSKYYFDLIDN